MLTHDFLKLLGYLLLGSFCTATIVLWPVALVRTAINKRLGWPAKAILIVLQVLLFPACLIYLVAIEKSRWLRVLAVIVVISWIIISSLPETRQYLKILIDHSSRVSTLAVLASASDPTSAEFCAMCTSDKVALRDDCLSHIRRHLEMAKITEAQTRSKIYCADGDITADAAMSVFVQWCKRVGPAYKYPEPRFQSMHQALSSKYSCAHS